MAEQRLVQVGLRSLLVLPQQLKRLPLVGSKLVPLVVKGFLLLRQPPLLRRVHQAPITPARSMTPARDAVARARRFAPCELPQPVCRRRRARLYRLVGQVPLHVPGQADGRLVPAGALSPAPS